MDKRQLRAFICVFEERNITHAAELLHVTQPALSSTIKALEDELDTQLFIRKPRGVDVTEHARMLYPHACRMINDMDVLASRFSKRQSQTELTIGIEQDIPSSCLSYLLATIQHNLDNVQLTLDPGCTGNIRLGCESLRCEDELFITLFEDTYALAYPVDHPISQIDELTLAHLYNQNWILYPESNFHQRFQLFYDSSVGGNNTNAGSFSLALDLVEAGFGLTIAPSLLIKSRCHLASRQLPSYPLPHRIGICYTIQALENYGVSQLLSVLNKSV
ncbi:LysR family transcriptional regulator [Providencia rustigianii]|uniref:Ben and cat operon transcriptional regulator n=1 Tax=Providencia rustigianii TaxID=158850 RepID=A0A379G129_9GAMM|nr:LysR family transcriptional regulator [Providencia rustigianii]MTC58441.1 LysR family transcriptional regulator [Providencia rustigianii]SUC34637.1 Ben and cat operon transcriptional regulator [Providencia rustigianii]VEH54226.1 Ben and cat operon transcriptional regulator [Providencia rustigianii]